jgi:hypothetical protein
MDEMSGGEQDFSIEFGQGGNSSAYCVAGWSSTEPDGTWTLGNDSRLVIPVPRRPATYVMVVKLRPLVAEGRLAAQRVQVSVNGEALTEWRIDRRTIRVCLVPWSVVRQAAEVQITLHLPDAARPSDLGLNQDRRRLGVLLSSLRFYPDVYEAWQDDNWLSGDDPVPVDMASVIAAEQIPLADLMMKFESLGQNCEFGLVQRQCHAEPLSLLRFSSTPLTRLLDALEAHFEGMGTPHALNVSLGSGGREYMINDSRFGFVYHAWVNAGEMNPDELARREAKRIPFLVRKLLEDLENGEKIFVFKGMGAMPEEEVLPLAMAIRRYGPNALLFVTLSDATHRGGTVEVRAPGFMVGYIDRFAPGDNAHDFLLGQWVKLSRDAYRLRLAARGLRPPPASRAPPPGR